MSMMPDEYVASIKDIDLTKLWREGRRLILTDLDNTLVPWNDPGVPSYLKQWLKTAQGVGFQVCIVSNNQGPRVHAFAEIAGIPYMAAAKKPKPDAFLEAMRRFTKRPEETVMVGDQLLTDVRGGKRAGAYTILVLPLHPREWWGTRIVRRMEGVAMRALVRRGLEIPKRPGNS
ncbi:YqeG family HAD IIIA-type phosphatase [Alicyclobacillus ferrooxydans]|uniref:HAD family hydrolase n=1 Tax=Alicyclobacillus ferrooxydans TaxID=471514 RepID=A0A0N8PMK5_9BACL|nr:YqeG family HAD IIIA-type phosphatase [Alicyclobacillus ferrooxydans]KPV38981.1 HAD family hydrolase [Alicyclobacillus ferrooxydans]